MSTAVIATPQKYSAGSSAKEFKEWIGKFTYRGFAYTLGVLALLFLINFSLSLFKEEEILPIKMRKNSKINIVDLAPPPQENDAPPPPPPPSQVQVASGPASVAGNPVPVPETLLAPDAKEFANTDEVSRATAQGGNGVDNGGVGDGDQIGIDVAPPPAGDGDGEKEDGGFTFVEQMPTVELSDIQKRVVYPEIAKRAGVEGVVTVYILVSKTGKPLRTKIADTDNAMLNSAAEKACLEATYTPGIQNGQPVDVWLSVPVRFSLR
jgi:periplasmic protein TonB